MFFDICIIFGGDVRFFVVVVIIYLFIFKLLGGKEKYIFVNWDKIKRNCLGLILFIIIKYILYKYFIVGYKGE